MDKKVIQDCALAPAVTGCTCPSTYHCATTTGIF